MNLVIRVYTLAESMANNSLVSVAIDTCRENNYVLVLGLGTSFILIMYLSGTTLIPQRDLGELTKVGSQSVHLVLEIKYLDFSAFDIIL